MTATRLAFAPIITPALVAAGLLLTACGGGGSSTPQGAAVASIGSHEAKEGHASAAVASQAADAHRPQLRVDTSDAEKARLQNIWARCLSGKGVPTYTKSGDKLSWIFPEGGEDEYPKQFQACQQKQPLGPASEDPDRNPHYADDFTNYVKCINRDSPVVKVVQTKDGWTWADSNPEVNEDTQKQFDQIDKACELEAFGRG